MAGVSVARECDSPGLFASLRSLRDTRERRARRRQADELLLAGAAAYPGSLLGDRADELTSERERRVLARSLERTAREVEGSVVLGPIPLNRAAARPHVDMIRALAARLRDDARPVSARGVLLVDELVGDGNTSPLYVRERAAALARMLKECLEALEPDSGGPA